MQKKLQPPSEHKEQCLLINWCFRHHKDYNGVDAIFAIPNGSNRDAITGAMLKREGLRAGIPDLMLPVARNGFYGLFIEMKKRKGGKVSELQKHWKARLQSLGYKVEVCLGFAEARKTILRYYNAI